jgi:hypothetical protein
VTHALLTPEQLRFFHTFGYIVLKQVFSPQEMKTIGAEFDGALAANYPDRPFDGSHRHYATMMDDDTPFFASLIESPPLWPIAEQIYGGKALGICSDGNRYVGNSGWHRDTGTATDGVRGVKFAIYLQPVGAETGALRVIPGSHRIPVNDQVFDEGVYKLPLAQVPATALCSEPGDVVAFDLRLWHASCGGKADRRMCTVVYYHDPETPGETAAIVQTAVFNAKVGQKEFHGKRQFFYSAKWVANPDRNPVRQRWLDRLKAIGYLDVPNLVESAPAHAR